MEIAHFIHIISGVADFPVCLGAAAGLLLPGGYCLPYWNLGGQCSRGTSGHGHGMYQLFVGEEYGGWT